MRRLCATLIAGMIGLSAQGWANPSLLHVDMPYVQARKLLLLHHWSPTNYAHDSMAYKEGDDFLRSDFLKRGASEVGACSAREWANASRCGRKGGVSSWWNREMKVSSR
jgi:hypothetical protein